MNIKQSIAEKLDFPKDAMLNIPKTVIVGNCEICVENYKGIAEYTDESVKLGTGGRFISIHGKGLVIKSISADDIVLSGEISSVEV